MRQVKDAENGREWYRDERVGFVVTNLTHISVCDLSSFGKVLSAVVSDGANRVESISFGSTKSQENYDKARRLAVQDATRKAKVIATELGVTLGDVVEATEQQAYRREPTYRGVMNETGVGSAPVPVSGGSLELSAIVNITWKVVPPKLGLGAGGPNPPVGHNWK